MYTTVHSTASLDPNSYSRLRARVAQAKGVVHTDWHPSQQFIILWKEELDFIAFVDSLLAFASHRECGICSAILRVPEDDSHHLCLACRMRLEEAETIRMKILEHQADFDNQLVDAALQARNKLNSQVGDVDLAFNERTS